MEVAAFRDHSCLSSMLDGIGAPSTDFSGWLHGRMFLNHLERPQHQREMLGTRRAIEV